MSAVEVSGCIRNREDEGIQPYKIENKYNLRLSKMTLPDTKNPSRGDSMTPIGHDQDGNLVDDQNMIIKAFDHIIIEKDDCSPEDDQQMIARAFNHVVIEEDEWSVVQPAKKRATKVSFNSTPILIPAPSDPLLPDLSLATYDASVKQETPEHFVNRALDTTTYQICAPCEAGEPCNELAASSNCRLITIASNVRERIYLHLRTTTSARLVAKPAIRYAKYGFPIDAFLINKVLYREMKRWIVKNNTFNLVVGHEITSGTVASPFLRNSGYVSSPPLCLITSLHLVLEVDLDISFTSGNTNDSSMSVYGSLRRFCRLLKCTPMPLLKELKLSIYEIVPPLRRIHLTCDVNEKDVLSRYTKILAPLFELGLKKSPTLEDLDVVYGDGYTMEGADPANWEEAVDYIRLWKRALLQVGCEMHVAAKTGQTQCQEDLQQYAANEATSNPPGPVLHHRSTFPSSSNALEYGTSTPVPRQAKQSNLLRYFNEGAAVISPPRRLPALRATTMEARAPPMVLTKGQSAKSDQKTSPDKPNEKRTTGLGRFWKEGSKFTLDTFESAIAPPKKERSKTWYT
ncbi:uncharacterized protein KY384_003895 [Bacidia gigantensis]|uniref:uncharacterized protein n=1 Tax=Bacidia gigantensis TaxID=2732470 RepID=UPI001D04B29F|nr:uncharacterized protein KY384_003895 [Bacidia gigantensis]KAG8532254.1 hypothetical protein KY384_003895 [Bacidia gigantensis]